jgi:membrane dipeptidase
MTIPPQSTDAAATTAAPNLIFDAHLDLSMNALEWNRDLTRPLAEIRARDAHFDDKPDRGRGTVCFPEMRRGGIGICVATLIARHVKPSNRRPGWHSATQAWAQTQGQLAWYRAMEEAGQMVQIKDRAGLDAQLAAWKGRGSGEDSLGETVPIGYILSLEGADSLASPRHLERAMAQGLRALGPAHYGPGTYAHGTEASGGLGAAGRELLQEMERCGIILDVTHLCDASFWEALELFQGPVWASHSNCRALVNHERQFSDEQLKALIERGAVIGGVLDAWMLAPGWVRHKTKPEEVNLRLERLIDHWDHICQLAGQARQVGLGTDLDGGFGREQTPADLESIADVARYPEMLRSRGYTPEDIANVMHGNFVRFLREAWGG